MKICKGDGECLKQDIETNKYKKDKEVECINNCKSIRCPNYILCNSSFPQKQLNYHNGLCMNCNMMYGTWDGGKGILNVKNDIECSICLTTTTSISHPKCCHYSCLECFKQIYYKGVLRRCPICRR